MSERNWVYQGVADNTELLSPTVPLYLIFFGKFSHLPFPLYIPADSSPSVCLPRSVFPPQGKGYSVLLFEVDICIIRLGCVIVSGLPHQRVLQRREGAVQPHNGRLPSSLTLQPACTCIPPTHPGCRPALTVVQVWTCSRGAVRESERKGEEGGGGVRVCDGSGRAGVEQDI